MGGQRYRDDVARLSHQLGPLIVPPCLPRDCAMFGRVIPAVARMGYTVDPARVLHVAPAVLHVASSPLSL